MHWKISGPLFQELYKTPDDSVSQNLVVQKAQLFVSRANAVYSGLQSYQYNINTQISDNIDQVNKLGDTIQDLNLQIMKVEAGGIETAMTLRDARDQALDELSSLVDISYNETADGIVKVSIEGTEFIDESRCYHIEKKTDKLTGFITPYWGYLSDVNKGKYVNVFDFGSRDISTENKNDMGELKALVLARGDHIANYTDIVGLDQDTYNDSTGMSVMLRAEAQLDQMIHGIVTALNDVLLSECDCGRYDQESYERCCYNAGCDAGGRLDRNVKCEHQNSGCRQLCNRIRQAASAAGAVLQNRNRAVHKGDLHLSAGR